MPKKSGLALTVADFLDSLAPGVVRRTTPLPWPPDIFALTASLLQRSGAYTLVVQKKLGSEWVDEITTVGQKWRRSCASEAPEEVGRWWTTVLDAKSVTVEDLSAQHRVVIALLRLMCAADEASAGIGLVAPYDGEDEEFESAWADLMEHQGRTCCLEISPDRVVVLPKLHTPRSGMTLRSLSHNLALYQPGEVVPQWHNFPNFDDHDGLKLLLLPWPLALESDCIYASCGTEITMPDAFGFFTCNLRRTASRSLTR